MVNFIYQGNEKKINNSNKILNIADTNKILKNCYLLLSMTFIVSSFTAMLAMFLNSHIMNPISYLLISMSLIFSIQYYKDNILGLILTFVFTGLMGWNLGPILNFYLLNFKNGSEIIMLSLGITGIIFFVLSYIALNSHSNKNYKTLESFLSIGTIVSFFAFILNVLFLHIPSLYLAISVSIALISGGFIFWQTNEVINNGETNYIIATLTIYTSIFNIFLTLLQLIGLYSNNKE